MQVVMGERRKPSLSRKLLERARAGDPRAFRALVDASRPRLEALVHLRLGPRLRAVLEPEDVLQETYLSAFRALESFEYLGEAAVFRWLATIAERTIVQLARHHLEAGKRVPPERVLRGDQPLPGSSGAGRLWDVLPALGTSPSRSMMREERFRRLEEALERLSPEHREVIVLARVHDLPIREIAERMGRTPEAVSMLLLRAVRRLRQAFGSTDSWHLPADRLASLGEDGTEGESKPAAGDGSWSMRLDADCGEDADRGDGQAG